MSDGWEESAAAWIADMGDAGDFGRRVVMDAPMMARVRLRPYRRALDVGCGEGRFCRMLRAEGIEAVGIDPARSLIDRARALDAGGDYRVEAAEALGFEDGAFDLVVSYLSLIDIPDAGAAIGEMARVLAPGGRLLIANLNGFNTAGPRWRTVAARMRWTTIWKNGPPGSPGGGSASGTGTGRCRPTWRCCWSRSWFSPISPSRPRRAVTPPEQPTTTGHRGS